MNTVRICEKAVLNVKEIMLYTSFGENTVREMLNAPGCKYVIRQGNRLYANRKLLDKYLDELAGN